MKVAVLGSGLMGSAIAWYLSRSDKVDSITVVDIDEVKLSKVLGFVHSRKISTEVLDVRARRKAISFLNDFDVVASALPHGAVIQANLAAIYSGRKVVDIAFEDSQMKLNGLAHKRGALLIPGCGLAPGLAGILLKQGAREIGSVDEGHIFVGGIPQRPEEPFKYRLLFSIVGLIREYVNDARVIRDGKIKKVRPFEVIEEVTFPEPIGKCEAFYTDGLATLLYTMKGIKELDERTIRWPGHAEKMKFLIDAGFFSNKQYDINGAKVSPMQLSMALLSEKLQKGKPYDITLLRVDVLGKDRRIRYEMIDYYDKHKRMTSMARTTGFTCSIVCEMIGEGRISAKGVVPPEIAIQGELVDELCERLGKKGVVIKRYEIKTD